MKWIQNLLDMIIRKEEKETIQEWEPEPLYIDLEYPDFIEDEEQQDEKDNKVIIIDL